MHALALALLLLGADITVTPPRSEVRASCNIDGKGYSWLVLGQDFKPVEPVKLEGGKSITFAVTPRTRYLIWVNVITAEGTLDSGQSVYDPGDAPEPQPGPGPGPDPEPQPTPEPTFPPGKYDLARQAYEWAKPVPAASRMVGPELARNLDATASAIAAGTIKTIDDAIKQAAAMTSATWQQYPTHKTAWASWHNQYDAALSAIWDKQGGMSTADLRTIFTELATGLKAVQAKPSFKP